MSVRHDSASQKRNRGLWECRVRWPHPAWGQKHQEGVPTAADTCSMGIGWGFSIAALLTFGTR